MNRPKPLSNAELVRRYKYWRSRGFRAFTALRIAKYGMLGMIELLILDFNTEWADLHEAAKEKHVHDDKLQDKEGA